MQLDCRSVQKVADAHSGRHPYAEVLRQSYGQNHIKNIQINRKIVHFNSRVSKEKLTGETEITIITYTLKISLDTWVVATC